LDKPVLFLDFDGVLHRADEHSIGGNGEYLWGPNHFCWKGHLEEILKSYPSISIMLSTDWRQYHDIEFLQALLGPTLGDRLFGVMPIVQKGSRAEAIQAEASRLKIPLWIGLDDHSSVSEARNSGDDRFVACHPARGLACGETQAELAAKLQKLDQLSKQLNGSGDS
jgi:HAD domain in Swiss Army Knife RNA repair proteins